MTEEFTHSHSSLRRDEQASYYYNAPSSYEKVQKSIVFEWYAEVISGSPPVLCTVYVIKPSALYMPGFSVFFFFFFFFFKKCPSFECICVCVCVCVTVCVIMALASQEHFGPQSVCPDSQAPDKKGPEAPWSKNINIIFTACTLLTHYSMVVAWRAFNTIYSLVSCMTVRCIPENKIYFWYVETNATFTLHFHTFIFTVCARMCTNMTELSKARLLSP